MAAPMAQLARGSGNLSPALFPHAPSPLESLSSHSPIHLLQVQRPSYLAGR